MREIGQGQGDRGLAGPAAGKRRDPARLLVSHDRCERSGRHRRRAVAADRHHESFGRRAGPVDGRSRPGSVEPGQRITVQWRSRPLSIVHRTPEQIAEARADDTADLIDPEPDSARVQRPEWLIVVGVCTHLGCIPLGQRDGDPVGPYGGWFCPCHGSLYDISGRVRRGPAPRNLDVPEYALLDDAQARIG
jgi:ubiquinol-cytochrome c reductase iron-sulfur subunit